MSCDWRDLMSDALDFGMEEFGYDDQDRRLFLVIAGVEIPVVQETLPKESDELAGGYVMFAVGEICVRKSAVLAATGGELPKLESIVYLRTEGDPDLKPVRITQLETSHGDPGLVMTLECHD